MAIRGKFFVALLLVLTLVALTPAFAAEKEKLGEAALKVENVLSIADIKTEK